MYSFEHTDVSLNTIFKQCLRNIKKVREKKNTIIYSYLVCTINNKISLIRTVIKYIIG